MSRLGRVRFVGAEGVCFALDFSTGRPQSEYAQKVRNWRTAVGDAIHAMRDYFTEKEGTKKADAIIPLWRVGEVLKVPENPETNEGSASYASRGKDDLNMEEDMRTQSEGNPTKSGAAFAQKQASIAEGKQALAEREQAIAEREQAHTKEDKH